jgi:serine/threonine protein kinase/tetratricopeptide (TPR) repeat protein
MIGKTLNHYKIIEPLGAGGMGEVYRAFDPMLQRDIALKVLPAETLSDERARARMLREARMAARLNHPHVCTVHQVGEADGQVYIAMELVDGRPLATILGGGPLPLDQALRFGIQMADALAHAQERGVVHRDLKSGNVVITPEGRAKVLDFGLAKQLAGEGLADATTELGATLTVPGAVVGTLAYMAPEQLRGQPADARSDIWALGVVLYEMVGGRRPFVGETGPSLSAAILKEPPPPLPKSVPSALRAVIERCLAKDVAERYQRAAEVRAVLDTVQSGGVIAPPPLQTSRLKTAVLPFANLTGKAEEEYLADGFTQEMITQLGRLHPEGLSVIARTSVLRYKTGDTPVDQIGKELGVDYVLEGSTQHEAGRVRITAELIDVRDQTQLWADSYERELSGILAVQSKVAQEVAEALAIELLPAEQARLVSTPTVDPEAHDAYLKGTYNWQKLTVEGLDNAQRYFELALEIDADYAPAYEGLAIVWGAREQMGITLPEEAGPKSIAAALRAVELDDESAKAHEALALARTWREWDWVEAEKEWRRTLELDPNGANAHAYYAHFLAIMGRVNEAIEHSERALELDPFNPLFHSLYSVALYYQRRDDDSLAAARTALTMQPDEPIAHFMVMLTESVGGRHAEAVAAGNAYSNVVYGDMAVEKAIDQGWAQGGHREAFRRIVTALVERFRTSFALPGDIALFCMAAGEHDQAIEWLEKGFEIHDPSMPYIGMPTYDPLHSDPRFQDLVRRMRLPVPPWSTGIQGVEEAGGD